MMNQILPGFKPSELESLYYEFFIENNTSSFHNAQIPLYSGAFKEFYANCGGGLHPPSQKIILISYP